MMDDTTRSNTKPKGIAVLNWALIVILTLYWAGAVAWFPLVDWYNALPLAVGTLVPAVLVAGTFWATKAANAYSRRIRGHEEIDSRMHVNRWLTAPVFVVASLPVIKLVDAAHVGYPWTDLVRLAFVAVFVFCWWRIVSNATIGDFTFERQS